MQVHVLTNFAPSLARRVSFASGSGDGSAHYGERLRAFVYWFHQFAIDLNQSLPREGGGPLAVEGVGGKYIEIAHFAKLLQSLRDSPFEREPLLHTAGTFGEYTHIF